MRFTYWGWIGNEGIREYSHMVMKTTSFGFLKIGVPFREHRDSGHKLNRVTLTWLEFRVWASMGGGVRSN